jgi:hypothetical protein
MTKSTTEPKTKPKIVGITIRIDGELNRRLSAILALDNMTQTEFFKKYIEEYVEANYERAMKMLDPKQNQQEQ